MNRYGSALGAAIALVCGSAASAQIFGFGGEAGEIAPSASPVFGTHEFAGAAPDPYVIGVRTGGAFAARRSGFPDGCYGVVTLEPTIELVTGAEAGALSIFTAGEADTTLAVLGPDGAFRCDDDGAGRGFNAGLSYRDAPAGSWKIWVGDFDDRQSQARLVISRSAPFTRPLGAPNARALPEPVVTARLAPGFAPDPTVLDVRTGYQVRLGDPAVWGEAQTGRCPGWVGDIPSAEIEWTGAGGVLAFMADSQYDTVIDVVTPSGAMICNDDMGDVDDRPQVVVSDAEPGLYQVFVGTHFRASSAADATLSVSQTPFEANDDPW
ncbi:MAG: hypothetical protein RIA71_07820 [Oceanicaulis sp.]